MRGLALAAAVAFSYAGLLVDHHEAGAQTRALSFTGVRPLVKSVQIIRKNVNPDVTCLTYKMKTEAGPVVAHVLLINPASNLRRSLRI